MLRTFCAALIAACIQTSCASAQSEAALQTQNRTDALFAPLFTNYSYFDHHWIQWLPDHPVYEAIEAQAYDAPSGERFIRVFLTERAPPKRQIYYFNDAETAARWSAGRAFARDIALGFTANAGGAHDLTLSLLDADGQPLQWRMHFAPDDALTSYGAGLRPSQGHAADTAYIFHYYGRSAVAHEARLTIGGHDYTYARTPEDMTRRGPKTGYTASSFTPVVRLGAFSCARDGASLRCDNGRTFEPAPDAPGAFRTSPFGFAGQNLVEMRAADAGLASYVNRWGAHRFQFDFEPALPAIASLRNGDTFTYRVSLDDADNIVTGRVSVSREGEAVSLLWTPTEPVWMSRFPMTTEVVERSDGYAFTARAGE